MAGRNRTRYALLGLLSWRAMSGYEIKRLVEVGLSHFWQESYGQLYPTLSRMEGEGAVRKREAREGRKRDRFEYAVTAKGLRELRGWLGEETGLAGVKNELLLKVFVSGGGVGGESQKEAAGRTVEMIEGYRQREAERLEGYRASEGVLRAVVEGGEVPDALRELGGDERGRLIGFLVTLRAGVLACEARVRWCDEAVEMYRGVAGALEDGD